MMKEENEELVCGGKRGREDTRDYDKPNQQKKSRANFLISELSTFESLDVEEDFVDDIDEECGYNLMKELMEEIGMVGHPRRHPPPAVDLSLQCSAETGCASCDSASSSTNCSSKRVDGCNSTVSTELESATCVVDRLDSGDYERARILGGYYGEEDFDEVFCEGGVLGKDSTGDEHWREYDVVRSEKSFNGEDDKVYEIEKSQHFGKRKVSRNHDQSYM